MGEVITRFINAQGLKWVGHNNQKDIDGMREKNNTMDPSMGEEGEKITKEDG